MTIIRELPWIATAYFLMVVCAPPAYAQPYYAVGAQVLEGTTHGGAFWGDFDRNGIIDVAEVGRSQNPFGQDLLIARIRNNRLHADSTLVDPDVAPFIFSLNTTLEPVWLADAAWTDDDADGYLDLLVTGTPDLEPPFTGSTILYRNLPAGPTADERIFRPVDVGLPPLYGGSIAWGDCDNDGDPDVHLTGVLPTGEHLSRIYRNDPGDRFVAGDQLLEGLAYGDAAWSDVDNDLDMDLVVTGATQTQSYRTILYRNEGNCRLTETAADLPPVAFGSVDWGDLDNDGDQDLLLAGVQRTVFIGRALTRIYINDLGTLTDFQGDLPNPVFYGEALFGDHNNDGRLDVVMTGLESVLADSLSTTHLIADDQGVMERYANDCSPFEPFCERLPLLGYGMPAFVDLDLDDDLDLLVTGRTRDGRVVANLFRNNVNNRGRPDIPLDEFPDPLNYPPKRMSGLSSTVSGDQVELSWLAASDSLLAPPAGRTPSDGLTYNLRVGTAPGAGDVVPPMSRDDGRRLLMEPGNVGSNRSWRLVLPPGVYYWTIQAVDHSYAGGAFAPEQAFEIP